jgi:hypothetical protein
MVGNTPHKRRIVPALGSLGSAETESHFPYIQALMEHGGQIGLSYSKTCVAAAFGAKGTMAVVWAFPEKPVEFQLRRLDAAIAIGQATKSPVDETQKSPRVVVIDLKGMANVPDIRIPNVRSVLQRGGSIGFGDCKPGAAVAAKTKGDPIAILAHIPCESVEVLLLRLDRAIALAHSTGVLVDEVFGSSGNVIH